MLRRMLSPLAMILVLALPARAQDDAMLGWTAWLYESDSGRITLVNSDGSSSSFRLPLAEGFNTYEPDIAVAPSGSHVAYVALDAAAETPNRHVLVYDVALDSLVASYPISPRARTSLEFGSGAASFDEAASRLAIGLLLLDAWVEPREQASWEIAVIDYRLGEAVATLRSEDEAAAQLGPDLLPFIYGYTGDEVTFLPVGWGFHGFSPPGWNRTYTWNTGTGQVTQGEPGHIRADMLAATGEVIGPGRDERLCSLPPGERRVVYAPNNVMQVEDPAAETTKAFYHDSRADIQGGTFIQNGERILVFRSDDESPYHWTAIERDGTVIADRWFSDPRPVFGTPDGFVYLEPRGTPALVHVNTRSGAFEPEIVWEAETTTPLLLAHIVQPDMLPESYVPWANRVGTQENQTSDWTAWLYESSSGCITRVNSDGETSQVQLPPLGGLPFPTYAPTIAVAPSGSHIAYVTPDNRLFVYDVALNSEVAFDVISPGAQTTSLSGFWTSGTGSLVSPFNEAASRLAVGSVMRADSQGAKPEEGWDIAVIDYALGGVVATLSNEDEAAAQLAEYSPILPLILRYTGEEVTFAAVFYNWIPGEGYPEGYPFAFTWNTATGEVTPNESFGGYLDSLAATGEVIKPGQDERLPAAPPFGDLFYIYPNNVLLAHDPAGLAHVFYHNENIGRGFFIQNGERILVSTQVNESPDRWIVIERDGTAIAEGRAHAGPYVFGVPDGFVYLEQSEMPALMHVNTRSGTFEPEIVWEAQTVTELVFVQSHAAPPESYMPWADLVGTE